MTALNPKKQKAGWAKIDGIFADTANVWVIHYSCESFYDGPMVHPQAAAATAGRLSAIGDMAVCN